jgi:hypothetical protein
MLISLMLESLIRIPFIALMSECVYLTFVLSCVYVMALRLPDPPPKESCRLCIGLKNWKSEKKKPVDQ